MSEVCLINKPAAKYGPGLVFTSASLRRLSLTNKLEAGMMEPDSAVTCSLLLLLLLRLGRQSAHPSVRPSRDFHVAPIISGLSSRPSSCPSSLPVSQISSISSRLQDPLPSSFYSGGPTRKSTPSFTLMLLLLGANVYVKEQRSKRMLCSVWTHSHLSS